MSSFGRARGGYISHGNHGYRIIGSESSGLAHVGAGARAGAVSRVGYTPRITLALGPRMGSAATAMRVDRLTRANHNHPHPIHSPHRPKHPQHPVQNQGYEYENYTQMSAWPPMFCDSPPGTGKQYRYDCLSPVKAKPASGRRR